MDPGLSYPLACLGTRYHQDNYPKAIPHEQRVTALECLKNIHSPLSSAETPCQEYDASAPYYVQLGLNKDTTMLQIWHFGLKLF